MALIKINDNPSRRELRQFAAICACPSSASLQAGCSISPDRAAVVSRQPSSVWRLVCWDTAVRRSFIPFISSDVRGLPHRLCHLAPDARHRVLWGAHTDWRGNETCRLRSAEPAAEKRRVELLDEDRRDHRQDGIFPSILTWGNDGEFTARPFGRFCFIEHSVTAGAHPRDGRLPLEQQKWWLAPIIVVLLLIGGVLVLGGTAAAPLIYTLF